MSTRSIILVTGHDNYKMENTVRLYKHSDGYPSHTLAIILDALTRAQEQVDENNKRFEYKPTEKDAQRINVPQLVGQLIGNGTSCYGMGINIDRVDDDPADYCEGLSTRHFGTQSDLEWIYVVNTFTKTVQVYGGGYTGNAPIDAVKKGVVNPLIEVKSYYEEAKANYTEKISHLMTAIDATGWKVNPVVESVGTKAQPKAKVPVKKAVAKRGKK